jgi:hypothetical protein
MPARCPPSQTVALCGLNATVSKQEVEELLKKEGFKGQVGDGGVSEPLRDKGDPDGARKVIFINCTSLDGAIKVCKALHERKDEKLGVANLQNLLQAVKKTALGSVDWTKYASTVTKTIEGKIARKRQEDCLIEEPMKLLVPFSVFEGSREEWKQLKKHDVLRVEAEEVAGTWKSVAAAALEVKEKSGQTEFDEAQTIAIAEAQLAEVLVANLRGKGWVSLGTIGPWFNVPEVRDALSVVKSKHRQLKNFVVASTLVVVKQEGTDFKIHLAEELSVKQGVADQGAKTAALFADVVTSDETAEEREARVFSFRAMCGVMELAPYVLSTVLQAVWKKRGKEWSAASGPDLQKQIQNKAELKKRLGPKILDKVDHCSLAESATSQLSMPSSSCVL